jgi:hypothetical protein
VFIADQITLGGRFPAVCTRLGQLADSALLLRASDDAYRESVRGLVHGGPVQHLPGRGVARVRLAELAVLPGQDGCARLPLRWETAGPAGQFPVLDADITLTAAGEDATVLALTGTYRLPPCLATGAGQQAVQQCAAATIHSFLARLACAIAHPAGQAEPGRLDRPGSIAS